MKATLGRGGLLLAVVLGLSCGDGPTEQVVPPRTPVITSAAIEVGGEGVIHGTDLDLLPRQITVDGTTLSTFLHSAAQVRFVLPPGRQCEVDGRPVLIRAGALSYTASLTVPTTLQLAPGESRILTRDDLTQCLPLPAANESYVITTLNPSTFEAPGSTRLLTLRTWTGGAAAAHATAATPASQPSTGGDLDGPVRAGVATGTDRYLDSPQSFDQRYATAVVGDTVRWVDFRSPAWYANSGICNQPRTAVPTFGAVVAAISTSGRTVIAYDDRTAHQEAWRSAATQARLQRLAEIAERWTLPAVREVHGSNFQPVHGGGGRWWHIFRTGIAQPTVDQAGLPRSMCPHFSEVATTLAPDSPPTADAQIEVLAGVMAHEYGHHAADVYAVRAWGNVFGRGAPEWSGVGESWAQTVQETAARLASGQSTGARFDALTPGSGIPYADFYSTGWGERPDLSPWAGGRGPYEQGTRLLMFLREAWGDAELGSGREPFYEAVMALPVYDFASMARLVGLDELTALDRWSLAEAVDDLTTPEAAARLPQIRSWVPQDREPLVRASRTTNAAFPLAVANGSYAAVYLFAEDGRGVSLTFENVGNMPFVTRLTRLR